MRTRDKNLASLKHNLSILNERSVLDREHVEHYFAKKGIYSSEEIDIVWAELFTPITKQPERCNVRNKFFAPRGLWGVSTPNESLDQQVGSTTKIALPVASGMKANLDFLFDKKTMENYFDQIIEDFRDDYEELLADRKIWNARWRYCSFMIGIFYHGFVIKVIKPIVDIREMIRGG